jgi:hypothetical protein
MSPLCPDSAVVDLARDLRTNDRMPEEKTVKKAKKKLREGKSPSTAAGEFVHEEIEHVREGEHGARSTEQAIAIGLSKARRAGIPLKPPRKRRAKKRTRVAAQRDYAKGRSKRKKRPSKRRSQAAKRALKREGRAAASPRALKKHAKRAARRRSPAERRASARKAAATRARNKKKTAGRKASKGRSAR